MIYFCVDVEASGPVPQIYNLLSIGATTLEQHPDGALRVGESFYVELKPIFSGFKASAMKVCGLDRAKLEREGMDPRDALKAFCVWIKDQNRKSRSRPVFVGHNAVFDWGYLSYYFEHFGIQNPFGYKGIDSKSLAMGRLGIPWTQTSKENLSKVLSLPDQDPAQLHRADYDAWYQALLLKALLERDPVRSS
jgi:DNA polymerase III epsilon subunit-like protein